MFRWVTVIISNNNNCLRIMAWLVMVIVLSSCSRYLFYPANNIYVTPDIYRLHYRDIFIQSNATTTLHGWWINSEQPVRGIIYYLHGNGGNISTNLSSMSWLARNGYHLVMLDYRGYGLSTGVPDVGGLVEDVQAGWRWLLAQPENEGLPVYVVGQSLGASIAGYAIATLRDARQPSAMVLDSGFASYRSIARDAAASSWLTWVFQLPVGWSMPNGYDLEPVIGSLAEKPLLIMHSRDDQVVPFSQAKRLHQATQGKATFYPYTGKHIGATQLLSHRRAILEFLSASAGVQ